MLASLVAASIVVRLGVIEAILRFYYLSGEDPAEVVRTSFASLFWTTTAFAAHRARPRRARSPRRCWTITTPGSPGSPSSASGS